MSETKIEWEIQHSKGGGTWYVHGTQHATEADQRDNLARCKTIFQKEDWRMVKRTTVTTEEVIR